MKAQPITPALVDRFCHTLANTGIVTRALDTAGIDRAAAYAERKTNPAFQAAWDAALTIGLGVLEDEVKRRAFEGVEKPIFWQGEEVARVREFSDSLAKFVLERRMKEYQSVENLNVNANVSIGAALAAARKRSRPADPEEVV